jgi:hypothetical protein
MESSLALQTFENDAPLSEIIKAIEKDGAVIVKNMVPKSTIDSMNSLIQPYMDRNNPDAGHTLPETMDGFNFLQSKTHRIYGLLGKLPGPVAEIIQHPVWSGIMAAFLSDETTEWIGETEITQQNSYQLTLTQSFTILPGCKAQPLHRDQRSYFMYRLSQCYWTKSNENSHPYFPTVGGHNKNLGGYLRRTTNQTCNLSFMIKC